MQDYIVQFEFPVQAETCEDAAQLVLQYLLMLDKVYAHVYTHETGEIKTLVLEV